MDSATAHALIRFGLGPRGTQPPTANPRAWLLGQLSVPDPALAAPGPSLIEAMLAIRDDRKMPREKPAPSRSSELVRAWNATLADTLATTDTPFRERLVWFWANHFTVSQKKADGPLIGPYLRDAIRPHVTGRFVDMLLAVMTHPAMLVYLDNAQSVGPASPNAVARPGKFGLNENLARECLELHTLGVSSGYTQRDVTAFAAVLTGWSIEYNQAEPGFVFHAANHEPGPKTVLGQTFPPGMEGGIAALTWLGGHPATYHRVATQMVRHFVSDVPPPDAVRVIETVLADTQGNLGAAARALVALPAAWSTPLAKLRTPFDWSVALARALDLPADKRADLPHWMGVLGQGMFQAPLPNGWDDTATAWSSGEGLLRRADLSWAVAGRIPDLDPNETLRAALGPLASPATTDAVRRAGSRREGLALLLAGPEFQRR